MHALPRGPARARRSVRRRSREPGRREDARPDRAHRPRDLPLSRLRHRLRGRRDGAHGHPRLPRRFRAPCRAPCMRIHAEPARPLRLGLPCGRRYPGLHRSCGSRSQYRCGPPHPQGQPVARGLRPCVRASLRDQLPPGHGGRSHEHPRYQALCLRPYGGRLHPQPRGAHRQARRGYRRRTRRPLRSVLPGAHGP